VSLTWQKLIEKVKAETKEITTEELNQQLNQGKITVIDIRENEELSTGHLPNAIFIPRGFLELRIEATAPERDQAICLYCGGGNRSALAARSLQELGYLKVFSLEGGISRWIRENRRVELPKEPDIDPQ
jgi:sulfur-carrier protein adenylyltransferase/sulfurtransferase